LCLTFLQEEKNMKKRWFALALAVVRWLRFPAGRLRQQRQQRQHGRQRGGFRVRGGSSSAKAASGKVYYLNFKPEQDQQWQDLAAKYTEETGVPVTVVTAAQGEYENTLTAEMAKTDAPTLFQVNGPVGLHNWKDYCYDLSKSDSDLYKPADLRQLRPEGRRRRRLRHRLRHRDLRHHLQQGSADRRPATSRRTSPTSPL
jgi:ABC-type glycerol-3-phosphate transport system substrate-binding protein